ncbi:DUF4435 domain-containing protein [Terriglobus roseus]|uniref:DUF4435 domain-containing protein n=1 Tax=Terriglobus roseus TaxID=392734 RepID=A0A1G7R5U0_9BACT|nr:DUF4435 domain-containing protein [Terriglobus roseus]SDG06098.1 Protein of unknown function [Terriglobus roseus]
MLFDRRRVIDLIARYKLEPSLRDIYVEGAVDERLVRLVLRQIGCTNASVFRIDVVDVTDDMLTRVGLNRGEKAEVIALACELERELGRTLSFTGIVDADADRLLGLEHNCSLLLTTDYTCMEMYWLEEQTIDKFLSFIGVDDVDLAGFCAILRQPLQEVFLIRAAIQALRLPIAMKPFSRYVTENDGVLILDCSAYIDALLNAACLTRKRNDLVRKTEELRGLLAEDLKHSAQGHDLFSAVIIAFRKKLHAMGLREDKGVSHALWWALNLNALQESPLFASVLARVS